MHVQHPLGALDGGLTGGCFGNSSILGGHSSKAESYHIEPEEIPLILSNTENVPGKKILEFYGIVTGSTVRAKHIGRDIMASFKNIIGGELKGYTELLIEAREEAVQRMVDQATSVGANAVINVRFTTSSVAQGAAELFAYGTAVKVE